MTVSRSLVALPLASLFAAAGCLSDSGVSSPPAAPAQSPSPTTENPPAQPAVAAPSAPAPLFEGWPKPDLALVLTGQQLGYIAPCGCTGLENQKGGLARRQTLIRQLSESRSWAVVPLDVGSQVRRFGKQQELKFTSAIKGLRAMGYRALALGENDLKLPAGELLAALSNPADGKIPDVVSANVGLFDMELQPRFLVLEAGGKRIGVTAVLGNKFEQKLAGGDLVHQPPVQALKEICRDLQAKSCDLNVLLVHSSLAEAREIAAEVPVFDLVVASGETSLPSRELELVAGTKARLMQVGQKAMYAGVVGFYAGENKTLRYQSVPLDARFADSPAMLKLLAEYQDNLTTLGLEGLGLKPRPHPSGHKFVGSDKCSECHTKAFAKWSATPHAHATDSLVKPPNSRGDIPRHFDPECLSCHVTGWEPQQFAPLTSGYLSLEQTPLLLHNGCENCHGPGSAHVAAEAGDGKLSDAEVAKLRDAMRVPLAGSVAERKCLECHDDDNSPDFHKPAAFEKYWKDVEHRGKD